MGVGFREVAGAGQGAAEIGFGVSVIGQEGQGQRKHSEGVEKGR
jgi:hypothetical protein